MNCTFYLVSVHYEQFNDKNAVSSIQWLKLRNQYHTKGYCYIDGLVPRGLSDNLLMSSCDVLVGNSIFVNNTYSWGLCTRAHFSGVILNNISAPSKNANLCKLAQKRNGRPHFCHEKKAITI